MSIITPPIFRPGQDIVVSDYNTFNTNLSNASNFIYADNVKTEAVSQFHLKYSTEPFNGDFYHDSSIGIQIINAATWTPVVLSGDAFNFSLGNNFVIEPGQGFRAHFDIWVDAFINPVIPGNPNTYLYDVPNQEDCYQFQFFDSADGATYNPIGCQSTYSITVAPRSTGGTFNNANAFRTALYERLRIKQKCNLTLCWINTSTSNYTIENLEVRARLLSTLWSPSITISNGTYTFMRFKN